MSHEAVLPPGQVHHMGAEQRYHSVKLAMWLFLGTEVLLFGGLFCSYAYFKWVYFDLFRESSAELNWKLGATNTVVLLISSFFMALAVDAAQRGKNSLVIKRINVTLLCGVIFMIIKGIEYHAKFEHGLFPPKNIYFGLYFTMTGLHGIHVLAGMGLLAWVRGLAKKNVFSESYYTAAEVSGLYWHLVDLIWIYLFPLLYLIH